MYCHNNYLIIITGFVHIRFDFISECSLPQRHNCQSSGVFGLKNSSILLNSKRLIYVWKNHFVYILCIKNKRFIEKVIVHKYHDVQSSKLQAKR